MNLTPQEKHIRFATSNHILIWQWDQFTQKKNKWRYRFNPITGFFVLNCIYQRGVNFTTHAGENPRPVSIWPKITTFNVVIHEHCKSAWIYPPKLGQVAPQAWPLNFEWPAKTNNSIINNPENRELHKLNWHLS